MINRLKVPLLRKIFALGDPRWGQQGGSGGQDAHDPSKGAASGGSDDGRTPEPSRDDRGAVDQDRGREPTGQRPRNDSEPPDLDEVWRDFNRRLSNLFGGKGDRGGNRGGGFGSGGGSGGGRGRSSGGFKPPTARTTGSAFGVVAIGGILLWLASGFYIVQEGQSSMVLRFGEYRYTANAGFQWRMPYPFESHEIVDLSQIRQITVGVRGNAGRGRDSLMLTKDENIVDLQFAVQYRVGDPKDYLFNNVATDDIVAQAAETAMREIVGRSLSDTVLYENKEGIAREALSLIQVIADRYSSGLSIIDVTIQNVQPPEEVQAAFSDAIKAGQDAERLKNEGQAYANDVIPRARGSAERLIQEAEGYRERVIATSQGDADRFRKIVVEYAKAPAVTRERLYLETMQQVFTNVSKVMVDSKSNSNLLYLPLDRLLQQSAQGTSTGSMAGAMSSSPANGAQTATPAETVPAPAPAPANPGSLRDRLREAR